MDEGDLYCNVRDDNFGTKIEIKQQREGGRGLHNLPNLRNIHNVAPLPAAAAALHDDSHICTITFKRSSSSPVPAPTVLKFISCFFAFLFFFFLLLLIGTNRFTKLLHCLRD